MNPLSRRPILVGAANSLPRLLLVRTTRAKSSTKDFLPAHPHLKTILSSTGLDATIQPLADLGYFDWMPNKNYNPETQVLLKDATAQDITSRVDLDEHLRPPSFLELDSLRSRLPLFLQENLETALRPNKFPFGQTTMASLYYLARRHPKLDLEEDVDFLFGSSTLCYLALQKFYPGEKCLVVRLPRSPSTILVTKHQDFVRNYSGWGFQLERFVATGKVPSPEDPLCETPDDLGRMVVHLQLLDVGGYKVVVSGEIDGMDVHGVPTEVALNLSYRNRFPKFFQAIGTGSVRIWRGRRDNWKQNKTELTGLEVLDPAWLLQNDDPYELERMAQRIRTNTKALSTLCASEQELPIGVVKELSFYPPSSKNPGRRLGLKKSSIAINQLFPNDMVVQELLGPNPN